MTVTNKAQNLCSVTVALGSVAVLLVSLGLSVTDVLGELLVTSPTVCLVVNALTTGTKSLWISEVIWIILACASYLTSYIVDIEIFYHNYCSDSFIT